MPSVRRIARVDQLERSIGFQMLSGPSFDDLAVLLDSPKSYNPGTIFIRPLATKRFIQIKHARDFHPYPRSD